LRSQLALRRRLLGFRSRCRTLTSMSSRTANGREADARGRVQRLETAQGLVDEVLAVVVGEI
jgi:hypothetical protein